MSHTIDVKHYFGGSTTDLAMQSSYPVLSNSAGSLIALLDKCLVSGFGTVTVSALTIDADGIATAVSAEHGYLNKAHTVIAVSGVDQTAINGEWRIISTTTNNIVFDATDSGLTNTTCTTSTSIEIKIPPLGWQKAFYSSPNSIAVYRSQDSFSRRHFLRIDDADSNLVSPRFSYMRGYEFMSSEEDTGTLPFPLQGSFSRGLGIIRDLYSSAGKYHTASSANISWTLVGTSRQFYLRVHMYQGSDARCSHIYYFGDIISYVPGDIGGTMICGSTTFSNTYSVNSFSSFDQYTGIYLPRSCEKYITKSNQRAKLMSPPYYQNNYFGYSSGIAAPDSLSNKYFVYKPILITDENKTSTVRGEMPGMAVMLNDITRGGAGNIEPNTIYTINNKKYMYMPAYVYQYYFGHILLSIDTDWYTPTLLS